MPRRLPGLARARKSATAAASATATGCGPSAATAATSAHRDHRIFDAPRELAYRAFTDPGQLAQWFGPAGCWVPRDSIEIDARPGGHLRFVMTAPDVRSPVDATFTDVVENELLAGEMEAAGVPGVAGRCACT